MQDECYTCVFNDCASEDFYYNVCCSLNICPCPPECHCFEGEGKRKEERQLGQTLVSALSIAHRITKQNQAVMAGDMDKRLHNTFNISTSSVKVYEGSTK